METSSLFRGKKKEVQNASNCRKTYAYSFWESQGPLMEHYRERGSTVKNVRCIELLCNKLKPAIRSKGRGLLSDGVVLLHEKACPHTGAHTVVTLKKLNFEVLEHPSYSPELALSDYQRFGPLKQALRGRPLSTGQQLKETAHACLVSQPKIFYSEGIK